MTFFPLTLTSCVLYQIIKNEYRKKLKTLKAPKETKEKISKEIEKFARMSPSSPDSAVSRNYLDMIFSLPWNKETKEKLDVKKAEEILNEEHYGLDKVKERILEYLSVRKLSKYQKEQIININKYMNL